MSVAARFSTTLVSGTRRSSGCFSGWFSEAAVSVGGVKWPESRVDECGCIDGVHDVTQMPLAWQSRRGT